MNRLSKVSFISAVLIASGLIFSNIAFAVGSAGQASNRPDNPSVSSRPSARPTARQRLDAAKVKSCQVREDAIKKRSDQLTKMATNMEEKFDSITKRVEDYYTTKVVPSDKTVSNYDSLVSDIGTKKAAVQTALTKAQTDLAAFSCDGSDPKGQMTAFKDDMQAVKQVLKDYRTSIKNLIVAVHSVTGTENRETPSPRPLRSPNNQGGNRP